MKNLLAVMLTAIFTCFVVFSSNTKNDKNYKDVAAVTYVVPDQADASAVAPSFNLAVPYVNTFTSNVTGVNVGTIEKKAVITQANQAVKKDVHTMVIPAVKKNKDLAKIAAAYNFAPKEKVTKFMAKASLTTPTDIPAATAVVKKKDAIRNSDVSFVSKDVALVPSVVPRK